MASNYLSEKASILEDRFVILENGNAYYICFYLICTSLLIAYCILRSFAFRFVLLNLIFGRLAYLSSCTICNTVNQAPTHYRKNLETEHQKKKKKKKADGTIIYQIVPIIQNKLVACRAVLPFVYIRTKAMYVIGIHYDVWDAVTVPILVVLDYYGKMDVVELNSIKHLQCTALKIS